MSFTTYFSPNQAAIAQVETYTVIVPNGVGNTYSATINGKTVTYTSVSGDTAATVAAALLALLNAQTSSIGGGVIELTEITFANPSSGVLTATAGTPGTPFANVSGTSLGLVLSTGNGLANGITTVHTIPNQSPSDINDPQNWLRVNNVTNPPSQTRALPQNADIVIVGATSIPMLWNLDQLASIQFASYTRTQDMTGDIGLPLTNAKGYQEWRARYFRFVGPQGSVPAGGLVMILGSQGSSSGSGPIFERYNVGSQLATLTILGGGTISFIGVHTSNSFTLLGGVTLNVAVNPGETAALNTSLVNGGGLVNVGTGVTWTAASTLTINNGSAILNSAPATLALINRSQAAFLVDALTWPAITMQNSCSMTWLAGGTITNLTMTQNCTLDKSNDVRGLTIVNSTIDGDTCQFIDPLNAITWTNATSVRQSVSTGPFVFTGTRTVKVT